MLNITEDVHKDGGSLKKRPMYMGFLFFAGILLPVVTLVTELAVRLCAVNIFDPIPTWWHVLFVAFVPITNWQIWLALRQGHTARIYWLGLANAIAIFVSLFYSILFAPLLPIAVFAVIVIFGLLPLAPLFSLIAGLLMRRHLRNLAPERSPFALGWKGLLTAMAIVFTVIALAELPFTLTKIGIRKANAESVPEQIEGLDFLRKYGDREYLLRLCYNSSGAVTTDLLIKFLADGKFLGHDGENTLTENARKAYYRLTGEDYRSIAVPRGVKDWGNFDSMRINDGLKLTGSQLDGSVDGDAVSGYLEWTLTFKNEKSWQQEALAQIQLPPNAVVSRLTLWINDEEREAAFAKQAKVVEAYNKVTATRRDPALLTMSGKDRVSLKCFPVPPNGEMKVRIGITMPLVIEDSKSSLMLLPFFQDKNFDVTTEHAVWIESKKSLKTANPGFKAEQKEHLSAVRGTVKDNELNKIGSPVRVEKSPQIKTVWARNGNENGTIVIQEINEGRLTKFEKLILIIDSSVSMKELQKEIAEAILNLPPETETVLVLAGGNGFNLELSAPNSFSGKPSEIAEKISTAIFAGGVDNVPAIKTGWELADQKENSLIIWIHSPQTLELTSPKNLIQYWQRRPNSSAILSMQAAPGTDLVDKTLSQANIIENIPRYGPIGDDLKRLFEKLAHRQTSLEIVRQISKSEILPLTHTKETSQHLVRLWANDEVKRLLEKNLENEAIDLAVKNQLVTTVTGAVVLETQQQYDQFGLKPVEANSVPTIPEPEEYLLFGVVLAVLWWLMRKFKMQKSAAV